MNVILGRGLDALNNGVIENGNLNTGPRAFEKGVLESIKSKN